MNETRDKTVIEAALAKLIARHPEDGTRICLVCGGESDPDDREPEVHDAGCALVEARAVGGDLLAALEGLLEYHRRDDYIGLPKQYQDEADAAIAKARGLS
jgi:hypothetical protein